ncbi:GntR family transcriptional regulator [Bacillota bacterium Meth-B3]|nr:GntR family transcriptional regulator [Christensenellaceae bacterium]MEA5067683.1 GntR family transcriptional regulator [Christensenellaceae bacterium]
MINKNSEIPIYIQLKEYIRQQIAQGYLSPGSRVMSETEISEKFQISRITIRKAFGELVDEGCLVRKKGKGTFIKEIRFREEASATSFSRTCQKLNMVPGSKVIEANFIEADQRLSEALSAEPGQMLAYMVRIRYANNTPVRLERNYYAEPYKGIIEEDLEGSIRKILFSKYDIIEPRQICSTVEIAYASAEESRLLGVKRSTPMLKVTGTLLNEMGKPIYLSEMLHLPDRCVLVL